MLNQTFTSKPHFRPVTRQINGFPPAQIGYPNFGEDEEDAPSGPKPPPRPVLDAVPQAQEAELFRLLADPLASLLDVAEQCSVTLEALSIWIMRPDILERLEAIENAAVRRARFAARSFLPTAVRCAQQALTLYQLSRRHTADKHPRDALLRQRADQTALRISNFLLRVAEFDQKKSSPPKHTRKQANPSPVAENPTS